MSKISELSDELLIKILSYLPTKVAASTMILSKQWQFLWLWLPNLKFHGSETESLQNFLQRNLPLYKAPVIERFCLRLADFGIINPKEVKPWVQFAISRHVRELNIFHSSDIGGDILPNSLYNCKSLVTLKLDGVIYMKLPHMVCFPSLKTMRLEAVNFNNDDSLPRLLSNCPVLEDLSIDEFADGGKMIVRVPSSLQRLSLKIIEDLDGFVIDTPSVKYLKLDYQHDLPVYTSMKNMPKLKDAFVVSSFTLFAKLIGSIPSVKRLTLCLSFNNILEVVFDDSFVFNKLKHLKLCICEGYSANFLVKLLKVSPNLQVLELSRMHDHVKHMHDWNQASSVPECILSSLETFKWSGYRGGEMEKKLVIYILQNASCLKTATILLYKLNVDKTLDIIKELALSFRASTKCQLVFH